MKSHVARKLYLERESQQHEVLEKERLHAKQRERERIVKRRKQQSVINKSNSEYKKREGIKNTSNSLKMDKLKDGQLTLHSFLVRLGWKSIAV